MGQSKRSGRGPRDEAVFARQPFMMGTRVVLRHSGGLLDLQQIVEPNYQQLGKKMRQYGMSWVPGQLVLPHFHFQDRDRFPSNKISYYALLIA